MTSSILVDDRPKAARARSEIQTASVISSVRAVAMYLASLKFTVTLFALTIVLVLAGTMAQVEKDIWQVIDEYFRTPIAWIDFQLFFPPSFFPSRPVVPGGVYFPGGWLLGALLTVNLAAAHGVRFTIQARGKRLIAGLIFIALGVALTTLVIVTGANHDGLRQAAWISWPALWMVFQAAIAATCIAMAFAWWKIDRNRKMERWLLAAGIVVLTAGLGWTLYHGEAARLDDSSMRILWQLTKGTLAGAVLLAGCILVFKKRAGIVVLHGGIGLMMLGELLVGVSAVEARMQIREGHTVNYVQDIRNLELAIIDKSKPGRHDVVSVPESHLRHGRLIRHKHLPFDIQVVQFMQNARLRPATPADRNPATAGIGLSWVAEVERPVSATDSSGKIDQSAAYIRFLNKRNAEELGTHLVGLLLAEGELPEKVTVDDKTYHVYLRFKRAYKPYSLQLIDVRKDDYPGTETPRNYSSDVRLVDASRNVDRKAKIWMNNPLRFAGETFYQSGYFRDAETGLESTTLSVVTNSSWMIPYVACMIVATGLLAHLGIVLTRFLQRRSTEQVTDRSTGAHADNRPPKTNGSKKILAWALPALVVIVLGTWVVSKARPPSESADQMQLYEFGKLPLVYEGRAKPFDTLACNSLRIISDRQTFVDGHGERQPAMRWLLDLIARPEVAAQYRVFRIENSEVLDAMGLERRKGLRYSYAELEGRLDELKKQAALARSIDPAELNVYQKKILELDNKVALRDLLVQSFARPKANANANMPPGHAHGGIEHTMMLSQVSLPLCIPPTDPDEKWQSLAAAATAELQKAGLDDKTANPAVASMTTILDAYAAGDAPKFNREVRKYQAAIAAHTPKDVQLSKTNFEAFFNHFAPFYHAAALYVIVFVLTALGWLGWSRALNRTAFCLIVLTLVVHTFALIARIYISGRPPVTNLYSSAIFIGWGCVVLGLVLEWLYKLGIGNIICSVAGFVTLLIAHFLAGDGDTFAVLQAVLDTQFWLATHVVCITLGYATTYVAGLLGILYILRGVLTPSLSADTGKNLSRMIYGTLCFATFFSFVGTVLGGLWADDSWGRFWGWDPKENGALIIVLWNALVLHARWGALVKQRGLALLAVAGNIAVSWSWFGVNELGVGLHSYGFTEGVLQTLGIFVLSQLAIITLGLIPERMWWSFRRRATLATSEM